MTTTGLDGRRSTTVLLALILAMSATVGGCGWFSGEDTIETVDPADGAEENGDTGDGSGETGDGETETVALGEITDPSETHDPDGTTPDTTPQTEIRRLRAEIQEPLEQGQWRIADQQATEALERTDLDPDFRLELEAYRDLARAADAGNEVAADDAIDRLERFEPDFIEELARRDVLPANIESHIDLETAAGPEAVADPAGSDQAGSDPAGPDLAAARLGAVEEALAVEDWGLAERLAGDLLTEGALSSEDTARARIYEDLAEAHLDADSAAITRATESLAALDPDLVVRIEPRLLGVEADLARRSDG